jgi:Allophanate hydrolase C-terminal domain
MPLALMFLTGDGMSGGPLHRHISGAPLVGERHTMPRYRFYSVRDEFPALCPVGKWGWTITHYGGWRAYRRTL